MSNTDTASKTELPGRDARGRVQQSELASFGRTSLALTLLLGLAWSGTPVHAQDSPPAMDVYLVEVERTAKGPSFGTPRNITDREGYDNQPAFLPSGAGLLYTSHRPSPQGEAEGAGQTEIFYYDLARRGARQLTQTPESEYSPTPIPGQKAFSTVRVEADGKQRLWRFDLSFFDPKQVAAVDSGYATEARLVLPDIEPVGYHAWGTEGRLALFVLGEPHTLQRVRRGPGTGEVMAEDIGRALSPLPGQPGVVSFVHKAGGKWTVKSLHLQGGSMEVLAPTLPEREDVAWSPDGHLWSADGARLFRWTSGSDSADHWQAMADWTEQGIAGITRLAWSPDGSLLAFVAERPGLETAAQENEVARRPESEPSADNGEQEPAGEAGEDGR